MIIFFSIADIVYYTILGMQNNLIAEEIENFRPLFFMSNEINPVIYIPFYIYQVILVLLSIVLLVLLTRIKRLKSGLVFTENKKAMTIGIFVSIPIITITSVYYSMSYLLRNFTVYEVVEIMEENPSYAVFIILLFVVTTLCLLAVNFWWRYYTDIRYKQRMVERNKKEHLAEMQGKDNKINTLTECNDFLSKAIHRDNKLIPAMYNALADYLSISSNDLTAESKAKGENILAELNDIMQERKDMIIKIQRDYKPLPTTGIERVDNILNYMLVKASENDIQFDFVLGDIKDISKNIIAKQALETLLSDLIENAIIAVNHSDFKKILVSVGKVGKSLEITIQDSGIPFETGTLANLGKIKSTTHKETGGSGIGYITIFEILNESKASLIIKEQAQRQYSFTKSVKIRFDGRMDFIVT